MDSNSGIYKVSDQMPEEAATKQNPSAPGLPVSDPQIKNASVDAPSGGGKSRRLIYFFLLILVLLAGAAMGYVLSAQNVSSDSERDKTANEQAEVELPPDAIRIQFCANRKGALYVEPENIPVGPVYMVHENEVIGVEFMLGRDEFLSGESYEDLPVRGMVDHASIGLLSEGHEGYTEPHYHVDLYLITKEEKEAIVCPNTPTATSDPEPTDAIDVDFTDDGFDSKSSGSPEAPVQF